MEQENTENEKSQIINTRQTQTEPPSRLQSIYSFYQPTPDNKWATCKFGATVGIGVGLTIGFLTLLLAKLEGASWLESLTLSLIAYLAVGNAVFCMTTVGIMSIAKGPSSNTP